MGLRTPLHAWHAANRGRLVDFAGWDMPVVYSSIQEEHHATRTGAGLFDISHMGRLRFRGAGAEAFLEGLLTNRVGNLGPNQARYALVLNAQGGTKDDVILTRRPDHWLLVVNASNREQLLAHFSAQQPGADVSITDDTQATGMVAVQGPKALALAESVLGRPLADLKYFWAQDATFAGQPCLVSRTGYTGEDGVEFILPAALAEPLWTKLAAGGGVPVGLGARDTLRLEAGMPLYGHELSEDLDPIQAGLGWAVKAKDKDFLGKAALLARPADRPVRVGLKLDDKRIPRQGFAVLKGSQPVGTVASGTASPTLGVPIAMAFVAPAHAGVGEELAIDIRGSAVPARVVKLPFHSRGA